MTDPGETEHQGNLQEKEPFFLAWWGFVRRRWLLSLSAVFVLWLIIELVTLPFGAILRLEKENPGETAFMREHADQAQKAGKRFRVVQRWVPLSEVPKDVVNAVIVAEDGQFWTHGGFDWFEFKESMERNLMEGRAARGASTITQQLVKNLYLSPSKNPVRKLREWVLTWWTEQNLKKSRILEIYLNVIEWGRGVYGIGAAAQVYFGKPVQELTRAEGIRLAAVIPNPIKYKANADSRFMERMTRIILVRMAARGMVKDSIPPSMLDSLLTIEPDSLYEMDPDSVPGTAKDSVYRMQEDSGDGLQRY